MSLYSEFKTFIQRGNVVDLAIGLIMGAAFTKIVNSLVADMLMPPIGYIVGGQKFTELKIPLPQIKIPNPLQPGVLDTLDPATINVGNFLQTLFDFLIVAACVFAVVKSMNALKREQAAAPPPPVLPTPSEKLLTEIRDLLKSRA